MHELDFQKVFATGVKLLKQSIYFKVKIEQIKSGIITNNIIMLLKNKLNMPKNNLKKKLKHKGSKIWYKNHKIKPNNIYIKNKLKPFAKQKD